MNTWLDAIASAKFHDPGPTPHLMFDAGKAEGIRRRAAQRPGMLDRVRAKCQELLAKPAEVIPPPLATWPATETLTMAEGFLLLQEPQYAQWVVRRILAMLAEQTWKFREHITCPHCDHVMGNVAALLSLSHDLLGPAGNELTEEMAAGLRRHILQPFLDGTRQRIEWWSTENVETNWKIMTCGEAGLAFCAFANRWPEAREAMTLAARGVIETLDKVAPEGDWPEGVGYWFVTLFFGLRFAVALKRLTGGKVDLFTHPALLRTGDYATMLISPGRQVFNFGDNRGFPVEQATAECLLLLATHAGRADWLWQARRVPQDSVLWLAAEEPDMTAAAPTRTIAVFPRTGAAAFRTGWEAGDTFVGFRSGPSNVGHSHLDANSFILESGGASLLIDEGFWWYGPGFFDRWRWDYDNCATIGHNTLLVDGKGQTHGAEYPGRIVDAQSGKCWHRVVGDAGLCYPGLLTKFIRTLLFVAPDLLVVRDVVACQGERHVDWLMHYAGQVRTEGPITVVENQGVRLSVTPLLPDRSMGWRVSDVTRTSTYMSYDLDRQMDPSIHYRGFSPLRAAESFEFLFALHVGQAAGEADLWQFDGKAGDWALRLGGCGLTVRPDGDALAVAG